MRIYGAIKSHAENGLLVSAIVPPDLQKRLEKYGNHCEVTLIDSRIISDEQRKKIYATMRDIADFMGEYQFSGMEYVKNFLKGAFLEAYKEEKGHGWFSLSDCSVEIAYDFTEFLIDFCFENNIPTRETLKARIDDIEKYLWICLKHRKCAICNDVGEVHHVDVIGMGRNRTKINDAIHRKICLCRKHHTEAHNRGWQEFSKLYHVQGIIHKE